MTFYYDIDHEPPVGGVDAPDADQALRIACEQVRELYLAELAEGASILVRVWRRDEDEDVWYDVLEGRVVRGVDGYRVLGRVVPGPVEPGFEPEHRRDR